MKTINDWLSEYGKSHQNKTNKTIHWICVPAIFFSIVCLLYAVKFGDFNLAQVALFFVLVFYLRLSAAIAVGVIVFFFLCLFGANFLSMLSIPLWQSALIIFVIAWVGQFYGHKIEGKKPSFLQDMQFLLIGPAWLLSFIYQKLNINY